MAGKGTAINLLVPECELQLVFLDDEERPAVTINRPVVNLRVRYWLRFACEQAEEFRALLTVACDTAEQAEEAAQAVVKYLPKVVAGSIGTHGQSKHPLT